jgi:hypothetical protein
MAYRFLSYSLIVGSALLLSSTSFGQKSTDIDAIDSAINAAFDANLDEDSIPTHREIDPIDIGIGDRGKIETMAMNKDGNLLLGVSGYSGNSNRKQFAIKVVSPKGKVLDTWRLTNLEPKMLHANDDGTIYVGSEGAVAILSDRGRVMKKVEFGDLFEGEYKSAHSSGVTASEDYFFIAFGNGFSLRATEDIVRFDRDLTNPKVIVKQQFGCCSHIDLDVDGDVLLIAENSRHRVNRYSTEGELLERWGKRDRSSVQGFAACCNPVNFDFGPGNVLYTAESGIGRVKKYSPTGDYLGYVGNVDTTKFDQGSRLAAQSCYIPVEVSADGSQVFVMDVRANFIRVLQAK